MIAAADAHGRAGEGAPAADPWTQHMRRGEWSQAWALSDRLLPERARTPCWHWPRHLQYVWTGAPLAGRRVLVRCYHGLGDTIQFIRYMPMLKAIAHEVIVWAQPKLIPLLRQVPGIDVLMPLHDGTPECEYDIDVELMELPHVFRTSPETVPADIPYLRAEPMPLPPHRGPAIGLVWRAGEWDTRRSITFPLLAPFAAIRDATIFILQPDAKTSGWDGSFGIFPGEFDIADYARAVSAMDLLVTIDSMPAHLGGALGVPTWTLLPADADWRWMEGRDDTPWYPGMRLFRQPREGDWTPVIDQVIEAIAAWSAQQRYGSRTAAPGVSADRSG
jgi:hypothetical protein